MLAEQFPSNVYAWKDLADRSGASVVTVPLSRRPRLDVGDPGDHRQIDRYSYGFQTVTGPTEHGSICRRWVNESERWGLHWWWTVRNRSAPCRSMSRGCNPIS